MISPMVNDIPVCFRLLNKISDNFMELVAQNYKYLYPERDFSDFQMYVEVLKMNDWYSSTSEFDERFYNKAESKEVDCKTILTRYRDIKDFCCLCEKSLSYKNKNLFNEEILISSLINHPQLFNDFINTDICENSFHSELYHFDGNRLLLIPFLRNAYKVVEKFIKTDNESIGVEIDLKYLTDNIIFFNQVFSNPEVRKIVSNYFLHIKTLKFNEEQFNDAIKLLIRSNANKNSSNARKDKKANNRNNNYFEVMPSIKSDQISFLSPLGSEKAHNTTNQVVYDNSSTTLPEEHSCIQSTITANITSIDTDNNADYIPVMIPNDIDDKPDPSFSELPKKISTDDVNTEHINTVIEYATIKNYLLTCSTMTIECFVQPKCLFILTKAGTACRAFLVNLDDKCLYNEILFLIKYPGITKIVKSIVPFGKLFSPYMFHFLNIFDISLIEEMLNKNLLYADFYAEAIGYLDSVTAFTDKNSKNYIKRHIEFIFQSEKLKRRAKKELRSLMINYDGKDYISFEKLLPWYNDLFQISLMVAQSFTIITNKNSSKNLFEITIMNKDNIPFKKGLVPIPSDINMLMPRKFVLENSLVSIIESKISKIAGLYLHSYTDNKICFECNNFFFPYVFDMINQYTILTFKKYIDPGVKPHIGVDIKKRFF